MKPEVIPSVRQLFRLGVADLPHAFQQARLAEVLQEGVEQSGQIDGRLWIARALDEVEQGEVVGEFRQRQRRGHFGVLTLLLIEKLEVTAHRLDPAGGERLALDAFQSSAQVGAEGGIEGEMVEAVRGCQPGLNHFGGE